MTDLSSSFLSAEEPELESIDFRQSLRFFQDQLILNSKGLTSATRSEGSQFNINFAEETRSDYDEGALAPSCKISIPTVDTILESVRVLRAIQKSQEQRGAKWSLHVASPDTTSLQYLHLLAESQERNGSAEDRVQNGSTNNGIVGSVENDDQNVSISNGIVESEKNSDQKASTDNGIVGSVENDDQNVSISNGIVESEKNSDQNVSTNNGIVGSVENGDQNVSISNCIAENDQNGSTKNGIVGSVENGDQNVSMSNGMLESVENSDQNRCINGIAGNVKDSDKNGCINKGTVGYVEYIDQNGTISKEISTRIHGNENGSILGTLTQTNKKLNESTNGSSIKVPHTEHSHQEVDHQFNSINTNLSENQKLNQEVPSFWPKSSVKQTKIGNSILKLPNGLEKVNLTPNSKENEQLIKHSGVEKNGCISNDRSNILQENTTSDMNSGEIIISENMKLYTTITTNEVVEESTTEILKIGQNLPDISQIYRISWDSIESNNGANFLCEESSKDSISLSNGKHNSIIQTEIISQANVDNQPESKEVKKKDVDIIESARSPNSLPIHIDNLRPESACDTNSSIYVSAECSPSASLYDTDENDSGYSRQNFDELKKNDSNETKLLEKTEEDQLNSKISNSTSLTQDIENTDCILTQETNASTYENEETFYEPHSNTPELPSKYGGSIEDLSTNQTVSEEKLQLEGTDTEESRTIENVCGFEQCDLEHFELSVSSVVKELTDDQKDYPSNDDRTYNDSFSSSTTVKLTNGNTSPNVQETNQGNQVDFLSTTNSEEPSEIHEIKKFTTSSWDLEAIMESLYKLPDLSAPKISEEETFQREVYVLSEGAFCNYPEGKYTLVLQLQTLQLSQESESADLLSIPLNYGEVSFTDRSTLKLDNKLGRCLYFKSKEHDELLELKEAIKKHCFLEQELETIHLVHYPLKCHQNVVIVDLGSCSTRAGILMDEPTLPFIFFPSVCAIDKQTANQLFGNEALQSEVRQNSTLSFPIRPSIKIIKHNIDINLVGNLFRKIFQDLNVDPTQYSIQVCLPRSLSINAQNALVKFLLEDLKVISVSLTHQALLTLYAHNVSTGIVVDIGDRMDILPVVDGFIVENGVTRLPHGGQRLIHHMKHALAEKHISLSNDIDAFMVQYITENLSYIAENYDDEIVIANKYPQVVKKSIALQTFAKDDTCVEYATLDDARFKVPEGLFKPELWGLDNPGIHKLVQKAILATGLDVRKKIAENIYISGGVTLTPGFAERLFKEVALLNAPRIIPKVIASNYRYHSTYIGACKFAKMDVFPKVCINLEEYSKNQALSLKKFVLCF